MGKDRSEEVPKVAKASSKNKSRSSKTIHRMGPSHVCGIAESAILVLCCGGRGHCRVRLKNPRLLLV